SCSYWKKCLSLYPETTRHNWLYPGVSLISPNVTRC
ncbi:clamp-binding protein CrfC, partial [Escherichia coli]